MDVNTFESSFQDSLQKIVYKITQHFWVIVGPVKEP